jgi:hypothetical protein
MKKLLQSACACFLAIGLGTAEAQQPLRIVQHRASFLQPAPRGVGVLEVIPSLSLEPVSATELGQGFSAVGAVSLGQWHHGDSPLELPAGPMRITRTIPAVWRMRSSEGSPPILSVQYEVVGANGVQGRLTHTDFSDAELPVVVEPLPQRIVDVDESTLVIEGGVALQVVLDSARRAGRYAGTIVVAFSSF